MSSSDVFFSFKGRINRAQFWKYNLVLFVFIIVLSVLVLLTGVVQTEEQLDTFFTWAFFITIWPYLAISVKRCHDRDKSGAWVIVSFAPVIGIIWWLIDLGLLQGTPEKNIYDQL